MRHHEGTKKVLFRIKGGIVNPAKTKVSELSSIMLILTALPSVVAMKTRTGLSDASFLKEQTYPHLLRVI